MNTNYAQRSSNSSQPPKGLWVTAVFIILATLSFLVVLAYKHKHTANVTTSHTQQKTTTPTKLVPTKNQHFDFYAMLPNMHVSTHKKNNQNASIIPQHPYFLLQIATTKDSVAGQKLITKLGVMGINSYLVPDKTSHSVRYRILAGPYNNQKNATTDQAYLQTNHINSLLIHKTPPKK